MRLLRFRVPRWPKTKKAVTISSMPKMSEASSSSSAPSNGALSFQEVREIPIAESDEAAECLAHAFAVDEVAMYFIETDDTVNWSPQEKWDMHVRIMRSIVKAHCLKGLVLTVGPNYGCVALWMPPGKNMDDTLTMFRSNMWRLNHKLSEQGRNRFKEEFLPLLHKTKKEVLGDLDNDSWYLVYIGTKPEARGNGYARRLIEHVTTQVSGMLWRLIEIAERCVTCTVHLTVVDK
ncbi:hypothetical protein XPA_004209 [Xanthoria parietina]